MTQRLFREDGQPISLESGQFEVRLSNEMSQHLREASKEIRFCAWKLRGLTEGLDINHREEIVSMLRDRELSFCDIPVCYFVDEEGKQVFGLVGGTLCVDLTALQKACVKLNITCQGEAFFGLIKENFKDITIIRK